MKKNIMHRILHFLSYSILICLFFSSVQFGQDLIKREKIYLGLEKKLSVYSNNTDFVAAMDVLVKKLGEVADIGNQYQVDVYVFETENITKKIIEENNVVFMAIDIVDYFNIEEEFQLEPIFTTIGPHGVELTLIGTKKHSNLAQLQGKRIVLSREITTTISNYWLGLQVFSNSSQYAEDFFDEIYYSKDGPEAITSVFFNKYDACLLTNDAYRTACEINPQIKTKTNIIETSKGIIPDIFCVTTAATKDIREKLIAAADSFNNSEAGKQILKMFRRKKIWFMSEIKPVILFTKELFNEYQILKNEN